MIKYLGIGIVAILLFGIISGVVLTQRQTQLKSKADSGWQCNGESGEYRYCMAFGNVDGSAVTVGSKLGVWVVGGQDDQLPRLTGTVSVGSASTVGAAGNCSPPSSGFKNCWFFDLGNVTQQTYSETFASELSDAVAGSNGRVTGNFTVGATGSNPTPTPTPIQNTCTAPPLAKGVDYDSIKKAVIWDKVPTAASYNVVVHDIDNGKEEVKVGITDNWYTISPAFLIAGHKYSWWIYSVAACGATSAAGQGTEFTISGGTGPADTCTAPPLVTTGKGYDSIKKAVIWDKVPTAASYNVVVHDITTSKPDEVKSGITDNWYTISSAFLIAGHKFSWWIYSVAACGATSAAGVGGEFTTSGGAGGPIDSVPPSCKTSQPCGTTSTFNKDTGKDTSCPVGSQWCYDNFCINQNYNTTTKTCPAPVGGTEGPIGSTCGTDPSKTNIEAYNEANTTKVNAIESGKKYTFRVTMINSGDPTWDSTFKLKIDDATKTNWSTNLSLYPVVGTVVKSGSNVFNNINVTAPTLTGLPAGTTSSAIPFIVKMYNETINTGKADHTFGSECAPAITVSVPGSTTPTPSPTPVAQTIYYRVAEGNTIEDAKFNLTPKDFNRQYIPSSSTSSMRLQYTFSNFSVGGTKFLAVQYKKGNLVTKPYVSKLINFIGPNPLVSGFACEVDIVNSSNLLFKFIGTNFGNSRGTVTLKDSGNLTIDGNWTDTAVTAHLSSPPKSATTVGTQYIATLTNAAGQKSPEQSCGVGITQISLGGKLFCRAQRNFDQENVELTVVSDKDRTQKSVEKVIIDKDGNITNMKTKLKSGDNYFMCIKAPLSVKRCSSVFPASSGTNNISLELPIGDYSGDGVINIKDASLLRSQWGVVTPSKYCDVNRDGTCNTFEWSCLLHDYNSFDQEAASVPSAPVSTPLPTSNPTSNPTTTPSPTPTPTPEPTINPENNNNDDDNDE